MRLLQLLSSLAVTLNFRPYSKPELEGKLTKWNNNAGAVRATHVRRVGDGGCGKGGVGAGLGIAGAIIEEDEEEEDEDNDDDAGGSPAILTDDVPQCFSHFTWQGGY